MHGYVVPYLTPLAFSQPVAATDDVIEVVALNVNYRNDDHERIRSYLEAASPDVIVIAELTEAWQDALQELDRDYPHQIGKSRSDQWGLRVYSRLPFREAELLDLDVRDSTHARIVLDSAEGPLELFAVHLFSPTTAARAEGRSRREVRAAIGPMAEVARGA